MLLTKRWKDKREIILMRDDRKCRNCGNKQHLQIHHRQYHRNRITGLLKEPWDYLNRYLITLCNKCHEAGTKQFKVPVFNK